MVDDLSSLFGGGESSAVDILKKLLEPENIIIKSEVNMDKIRVLLKIKWFAAIKKEENQNKPVMEIFQEEIIPYYLSLMCSLDRKSRTEIITAIKDMNEKFITQDQSMLGVLGGKK